MRGRSHRLMLLALQNAPLLLFVLLLAVFGVLSDRFLSSVNAVNIVIQAAHVGIIAIGMTFVLLVGGIDLSVGANMYLSAAVLGLFLSGLPLWLALPVCALIGLAFGLVNAFFIVRLRIAAFIVTLATLFVGRGVALYFSQSALVKFSPEMLAIGRGDWLGVPTAIWAFGIVFVLAWITLRETPFGRHVYAVGADPDAAAKAGIPVRGVLVAVYCICGVLAAVGGLVSASQVAVASSTFGYQKEFPVVAAAVLGGTSLFGGRGGVLGTVFGAVLIQTVENGLVMTDADPYMYLLVIATIIFIAVLIDAVRTRVLERLERRQIRPHDLAAETA